MKKNQSENAVYLLSGDYNRIPEDERRRSERIFATRVTLPPVLHNLLHCGQFVYFWGTCTLSFLLCVLFFLSTPFKVLPPLFHLFQLSACRGYCINVVCNWHVRWHFYCVCVQFHPCIFKFAVTSCTSTSFLLFWYATFANVHMRPRESVWSLQPSAHPHKASVHPDIRLLFSSVMTANATKIRLGFRMSL